MFFHCFSVRVSIQFFKHRNNFINLTWRTQLNILLLCNNMGVKCWLFFMGVSLLHHCLHTVAYYVDCNKSKGIVLCIKQCYKGVSKFDSDRLWLWLWLIPVFFIWTHVSTLYMSFHLVINISLYHFLSCSSLRRPIQMMNLALKSNNQTHHQFASKTLNCIRAIKLCNMITFSSVVFEICVS